MNRRFIGAFAITLLASSVAVAQEKPKTTRHSYKMSVKTNMKYKAKEKEFLFYSPISFRYDIEQSGSDVSVQFTRVNYIINENGKQALLLTMDKDQCYIEQPNRKESIKYATASPGTKVLMDSIFRVPLAKLTVDKDGKELTRKVSKESDHGKAFDANIHNARWFHPSFPTAKKWVEKRSFDIRNRGVLTGEITYTKQDKKDAQGHTVVKVFGVLTAKEVDTQRGKAKGLIYAVQGTQSYDEKRKIWVSGKTIVAFNYVLANSPYKGSMVLELKLNDQDPAKVAKKEDPKPTTPVSKVDPKRKSYKLSVNTRLKYKSGTQNVTVDTPNTFQYDNIAKERGFAVQFTEVVNTVIVNGAESIRMRLTKDGTETRDQGRTEIETYEQLAPKDRALLDSLFSKPIATITTTQDGTELTRMLSDDHKVGVPVGATIHNLRWFHARFAEEQTWIEDRTFDIGQNGRLSGAITFTKLNRRDASGNTLVKITGTMAKAVVKTSRGQLKNAKYVFNGIQSYDEKQKIWVSGQTNVTLSYSLHSTPVAGTMTLKLELNKGQVKPKAIKVAPSKKLPEVKFNPVPKGTHSYQLSIDTTVASQGKGEVAKITNPVLLRYANDVGGAAVTVRLKEFKYHVVGNGKTKLYVEMNKDQIGFHNGGKKQVIAADKVDPKNKALMTKLFSKPFAEITVDGEGKELTRKVGPGNEGGRAYDATVHNTRWFHSRFAATKTWVETVNFDVSKGGFITGALTFTKQDKKDASGHTVVKVTGSIIQARVNTLRGPLRNARFIFDGTRTYDEKRRIWVSGLTKVKMSYLLLTVGGALDMAGTMTLKLTLEKSETDIKGTTEKSSTLGATKQGTTYPYQLKVHTTWDQTTGKDKLQIETPHVFLYNNIVHKNKVTVQFKDILYVLRVNGAHNLLFKVNNEKTILYQAGKKPVVTLADKVDAGTKSLMKILFQSPFLELTLDKDGKELTRKLGPGVERGETFDATIPNVRWFHPSFPAAKSWVETRSFDIRKGGFVSGPLTYTKLDKKDSEGNTIVKLSGVIKKASVKTQRGEVKNVTCVFNGLQSFDEKRRIWTRGQTNVLVTFQLDTKAGPAKINGTMRLTLGPPEDAAKAEEKNAKEDKTASKTKPVLDLSKADKYEISSKRSELVQVGADKATNLTETKISYAHQWQKKAISISLIDYLQRTSSDGKEKILLQASENLYRLKFGSLDRTFNYKEATGSTRDFMNSLFRSKYATVTVDRMGKERKREIHAPKNNRLFSSLIHIVRWFHPRYSSEETWTENRVLEVGEGNTISGPLTFTKQANKNAAGQTVVTMSGTMTRDSLKTTEGPWLNVKFVFTGELAYDEDREIWVGGQSTVKFSYKRQADKAKLNISGTETLTMKITKN